MAHNHFLFPDHLLKKSSQVSLFVCLMVFNATIFQLYRGGQFYWWRKPADPEKTFFVLMKLYTKPSISASFQTSINLGVLNYHTKICLCHMSEFLKIICSIKLKIQMIVSAYAIFIFLALFCLTQLLSLLSDSDI
jgi:hypothetical protein